MHSFRTAMEFMDNLNNQQHHIKEKPVPIETHDVSKDQYSSNANEKDISNITGKSKGDTSTFTYDHQEHFELGNNLDDFNIESRQSSKLNHVHKLKKDKGKKKDYIGFEHENWNLMLHMIFGVSKSVRNCVLEEAFDIVEEDFNRKYCYELISQKTEKLMNNTYLFYDFSPKVFH